MSMLAPIAIAVTVAAIARWISRDPGSLLTEPGIVTVRSGARHRIATLLTGTLCILFAAGLAAVAGPHLREGVYGFYVVEGLLVGGGLLVVNESRGITLTLTIDTLSARGPWRAGVCSVELARIREIQVSPAARWVRFYDASGMRVSIPTTLPGSDALLRQLQMRLAHLRPELDARQIVDRG